ncbi:unnamed protein product [Symbiodinium microadriaticum]|nr:unnamed protein product [Symbiodinium microadriaticum]
MAAEESEAKKKKKKERDPLDWEDDKFPKMADRPVEQAQIDPSYLAKMRQEAKKQYIEALGPDPAKVQRTWKFHFGICALENVTQNEWEVFLAVSETGNKTLSLKLGLLLQETRRVRGPPRRQAIWAAKVVGVEMLICAILGLAMCFHGVVSGIVLYSAVRLMRDRSDANYRLFKTLAELLLCITNVMWVVNALGLGLLSGILWQVHPPKDDSNSAAELTRGLVSMSSLLGPRGKEAYDQVVKQLANRCVSLEALLSFWERLRDGQTMPGFDPRRSLTNDVVRRAIIPESRVGDDGYALATLWSGKEMKPQVMVTHNWTNGFGSLVSAILADALGRPGYQEVSAQIATPSGIEQVRAKLGGKLKTTYWVCAFCINQHASICGGFGPEPPHGTHEWAAWNRRRYDSVTGEAFMPCNCQVEKVFSHTDARSELNKFDDMMTHLAQRVGRFAQLIVVDDAFDVLYRAWCVAEIFEASVLGMESRIQVSSQDAVDQNYDRLSLLDVRQCTASSQADKDMIMAKIADVEVFNWRIQQLIFAEEMGLFVRWVEGNERSRQVGRIIKRCEARAPGTEDKPAHRSRRCFASLRLLTSPEGDSDESSELFDQFKNRLHGNFQYTKGYKVRGGTRKKFKRMEQVYSKEHNLSYKQMQNHFVTMDVWTVSKLQFNTLLGTAKRSFYDLANDNVYQYIGIKAAGQAQAQKARLLEMHSRALRLDHLSLYLSRWLSMRALGISVLAPASASTWFHVRPRATDHSSVPALADMDLLHAKKAPAVYLHARCKMVHVRVLAGVGIVAGFIHMSGVEAERNWDLLESFPLWSARRWSWLGFVFAADADAGHLVWFAANLLFDLWFTIVATCPLQQLAYTRNFCNYSRIFNFKFGW